MHLDFVVDDLAARGCARQGAGRHVEQDVQDACLRAGSRMFADPFGNGFCLLEFRGRGYDEIAL